MEYMGGGSCIEMVQFGSISAMSPSLTVAVEIRDLFGSAPGDRVP